MAQHFRQSLETDCMNTDPRRNKPGEEGKNNDPNLRDESAAQPGINTIKNSEYDKGNQQLTKTAADDFRESDENEPGADPSFDEVDYD
jgi:hypothetical protein